ncbi:hypothetical protein SAMN05443550_12114 [Pedobacter hartonius]|uniref:Uncharacterized protein n=1 Tax=Pedobacter hartonius TaxID=425514 RepID=A0A1H4HJS5_9SPHI|nr:hypothetical protein SAMN05443550_12114 [Pedobacter hartonius]
MVAIKLYKIYREFMNGTNVSSYMGVKNDIISFWNLEQ